MSRGTVRRTYQAPRLGLIFGCRCQHHRSRLDSSIALSTDSHLPTLTVKSAPGTAHHAKTDVLVVVVAPIVVAVSGTAFIRVVEPRAAAQSGSPAPSSMPRKHEGTEYLFPQLPSIAMS
jgi:hypothetical protein